MDIRKWLVDSSGNPLKTSDFRWFELYVHYCKKVDLQYCSDCEGEEAEWIDKKPKKESSKKFEEEEEDFFSKPRKISSFELPEFLFLSTLTGFLFFLPALPYSHFA